METTQAATEKLTKKLILAERVEYFSNWYQAKHAVALCQCFVRLRKYHLHKKWGDNEELQPSL